MKIELKKWERSDLETLAEICNTVNRDYLSNRLPKPYTKEHALYWLNLVQQMEQEKTGLFRLILADGMPAGSISIERFNDVFEIDAEIGYMMKPEYSGKGIMSEAVHQMTQLAFELLPLERITGKIYEENIASQKVLERNGFVLEGKMKNAVIKYGIVHDLRIYGKIKQ